MPTIYDRLLLAKLEVTKGTDPIPVAASDAVRVQSFKIAHTINNADRPAVKGTMGNMKHIADPDPSMNITITAELKGSGTAGTAPSTSPLIQACRTVETIVAGTSVTYAPSTNTEKSCTIYAYMDGLLWKFIGCVGTMTIQGDVGTLLMATFTMSAKYAAPVVAAVPAGAVFDASLPVMTSSIDVINDGAAINVGAFGVDLGNDVQEHKTIGYHSFVVANRAPTMTFTKDSVATVAEWSALLASTNASLSAAFGATAGNITTITAPAGVRTAVAYSERAEKDTLDVTYNLYESASDDQFALAFT